MSKVLRVLSGLHRGAEVPLAAEERYIVGADAQAAVILCDRGVAARHCLISIDAYGWTCRALDAPLSVGDRELGRGEAVGVEEFELIRCGAAAFSVGPATGDWSAAELALRAPPRMTPLRALRSLQRLNPLALFATVLLGIVCVIGLAYAALSDGDEQPTPARVEAAREWLRSIAPDGSELTIGVDQSAYNNLLLSGYVRQGRELQALASASRSSRFNPRLDVYAVDELVASMVRVAQLSGLPCEPQYKVGGHLACGVAVESEAAATRLRNAARDVPGLRSLDVRVVSAPAVSVASTPPLVDSDENVRLTRKFSVLMVRNRRYLVGPYGERYAEGEEFDGFKINRIGLDEVRFERNGREFQFHVAALRGAR